MASGMLKVEGSIDLDQFWPPGTSDADTTKILITVGPSGFQFRSSPGRRFKPTSVFDGAVVTGEQGTKPVVDKKGRITVRLQGIDAPELHYRPQSALKDQPNNPKPGENYRTAAQKKKFLELNEDYRQPYGETATVQLKKYLASIGANPLPCKVVTSIDRPNEAFDVYGRLVGDVVVEPQKADVNHWLLRNGWALPAFYNSMAEEEITTLTALANKARKAKRGIWPQYAARIGSLEKDLVFRRKGTYVQGSDIGNVILPKMFRRLCAWTVNFEAGMVRSSFAEYLASKTKDEAMLAREFLEQGDAAAQEYGFHEFFKKGRLTVRPEELVIKEKPSRLKPAKGRTLAW